MSERARNQGRRVARTGKGTSVIDRAQFLID
ncbi:MAG: hypothetical protein QOE70_1371 [Chthoniobacter sp.]|jgi:hypothetical protein|nr:hypothetical protein [Chthoniobacter sp.]